MEYHKKNAGNKMGFFCACDAAAASARLPLQKGTNLVIPPHLKSGRNNECSMRCKMRLWSLTSDLHTTAQDRGSLKGLLPVGTPTSRASLPAFCRQYCWSSAAAWDTCDTRAQVYGTAF